MRPNYFKNRPPDRKLQVFVHRAACRRQGKPPAKFRNRGSAAPIKTAKEPDKNIGSNCILIFGARKFLIANKEVMKQFFKPDLRKIILFMTFMFVAFGGYTESWVFSGKDAGLPKPPLFDLLAPFPFWIVWVFLLAPLALLSNLLVAIGGYDIDFIMRGPFRLFGIINLIYFYALSCLIIFVVDKLRRKR